MTFSNADGPELLCVPAGWGDGFLDDAADPGADACVDGGADDADGAASDDDGLEDDAAALVSGRGCDRDRGEGDRIAGVWGGLTWSECRSPDGPAAEAWALPRDPFLLCDGGGDPCDDRGREDRLSLGE